MQTELLPKIPFDIEEAMPRIEKAVAPFPKAGLFALYDEGYTTLFEQLVACMLSIRTLDEVMVPISRNRSDTDISMEFIMPTVQTSRAITTSQT